MYKVKRFSASTDLNNLVNSFIPRKLRGGDKIDVEGSEYFNSVDKDKLKSLLHKIEPLIIKEVKKYEDEEKYYFGVSRTEFHKLVTNPRIFDVELKEGNRICLSVEFPFMEDYMGFYIITFNINDGSIDDISSND